MFEVAKEASLPPVSPRSAPRGIGGSTAATHSPRPPRGPKGERLTEIARQPIARAAAHVLESTHPGQNTKRVAHPTATTEQLLQVSAKARDHASGVVRKSEQTKATQLRTQKDKDEQVERLIKRKVKDTITLQSKLQDASEELCCSLRALESAAVRAQQKLEEKRITLEISKERLSLRDRVFAEQGGEEGKGDGGVSTRKALVRAYDPLEKALTTEQNDLRETVEQLETAYNSAEAQIQKMRRCRDTVQQDIESKAESLHVDSVCLGVSPSEHNSRSMLMVVEAANQNTVKLNRSTLQPDFWKKSALQMLDECHSLTHTASHMKKLLYRILRAVDDTTAHNSRVVTSALEEKLALSTKQHRQLQHRVSEINQECGRLRVEGERIEGELEQVARPMEVVQQRISLRNSRPNGEAVRDAVEEALEGQYQQLKGSMGAFREGADQVHAERELLETTKEALEEELAEKASEITIHQKCLELDASTRLSAREPPSARLRKKRAALPMEIHPPKPPAALAREARVIAMSRKERRKRERARQRDLAHGISAETAKRNAESIKQAIAALAYTRPPKTEYLNQRDLGNIQVESSATRMGWS